MAIIVVAVRNSELKNVTQLHRVTVSAPRKSWMATCQAFPLSQMSITALRAILAQGWPWILGTSSDVRLWDIYGVWGVDGI